MVRVAETTFQPILFVEPIVRDLRAFMTTSAISSGTIPGLEWGRYEKRTSPPFLHSHPQPPKCIELLSSVPSYAAARMALADPINEWQIARAALERMAPDYLGKLAEEGMAGSIAPAEWPGETADTVGLFLLGCLAYTDVANYDRLTHAMQLMVKESRTLDRRLYTSQWLLGEVREAAEPMHGSIADLEQQIQEDCNAFTALRGTALLLFQARPRDMFTDPGFVDALICIQRAYTERVIHWQTSTPNEYNDALEFGLLLRFDAKEAVTKSYLATVLKAYAEQVLASQPEAWIAPNDDAAFGFAAMAQCVVEQLDSGHVSHVELFNHMGGVALQRSFNLEGL